MERLSHNHADDTSELLSAYVDNVLDVAERRKAEAQVERCLGCAQELRDLRMFKTLLQELPSVQPPRSFTLDPATAVGPRWLLFPTLRLASLVASVLFFVVLGADLLNIGGASPQATTSAFSTKEAPAAQRQLQADDTAGGAPESAENDANPAPSTAASTAPLAAIMLPTVTPAEGADAPVEALASAPAASSAPSDAAANAAPATGAAGTLPPSAASAPAAVPEAADQAPADDASSLQANEPSSPDTTVLQADAEYQDDSSASTTLRIVEIGLGLIALGLAGGAAWAWRQQR